MMKTLLRAMITSAMVSYAGLAAASVDLKSDHPDVYYVKQGDTLWDISSTFLDSPWQWPELWHVNQEIDNPHLIYPGDVIHLVYVDGQPRLQLERKGSEDTGASAKMMSDGSIVKLKPEIRVSSLDSAIPAIPLDSVQTFLKDALVLTPEEIKSAPYIVGGEDGRVVYGKNDRVYVRDPYTEWASLSQNYGFHRVGEKYVDPETQEILGYEALQVGLGRVTNQQKDIATMRILKSTEELKPEDRAFTTPERAVQSVFYPSAPTTEIDARVIHFFGRLSGVARNDVVVINKGTREGLVDGNVLEVRQAGEKVKDRISGQLITLPSETIGTLVIFRTYEKVSYALVVRSTAPISKNDIVTNPVGSL